MQSSKQAHTQVCHLYALTRAPSMTQSNNNPTFPPSQSQTQTLTTWWTTNGPFFLLTLTLWLLQSRRTITITSYAYLWFRKEHQSTCQLEFTYLKPLLLRHMVFNCEFYLCSISCIKFQTITYFDNEIELLKISCVKF